MSDFYGRLANCTLHGIEFTESTKDGKPWRFRNLIRLHAAGFEIELHQNTSLPSNRYELHGKTIFTTELFVRNVATEDVSGLRQVIAHVCELLSFSTESRVLPYYSEYPANSGLWEQIRMAGTVQTWRPPFAEPENAQHLIDTCYDQYVNLRDRRRLHVAIEYVRHSVMSLAAEVQIAIACIAFENLRHNWALDSGYPFIKGRFREKTGTITAPGSTADIRSHLEEMFKEVNMTCDAKRIVDTRNEVIHTGLYGDAHNEETHNFLETALREYFLRLIGYRGPFRPYNGGSPAFFTI
jgi:hypothetical protein